MGDWFVGKGILMLIKIGIVLDGFGVINMLLGGGSYFVEVYFRIISQIFLLCQYEVLVLNLMLDLGCLYDIMFWLRIVDYFIIISEILELIVYFIFGLMNVVGVIGLQNCLSVFMDVEMQMINFFIWAQYSFNIFVEVGDD